MEHFKLTVIGIINLVKLFCSPHHHTSFLYDKKFITEASILSLGAFLCIFNPISVGCFAYSSPIELLMLCSFALTNYTQGIEHTRTLPTPDSERLAIHSSRVSKSSFHSRSISTFFFPPPPSTCSGMGGIAIFLIL